MRILVTGATGFIGYDLVRRLAEERHEISCLVRETSRTDRLKEAGVSFVTGCVTNSASVKMAVEQTDPEAVFHCAARVTGADKTGFHHINAEGTENVCRASLEHGVGRLIHISSIAAVNGNKERPLTDDLPFNPTGAYGRSKIAAERIVVKYRDMGLKAAMIRPCMVYGENEPHAMDRLLKWVEARRLPLPDIAAVDTPLQMVYLGNVTHALILALEREEALSGTFLVADKDVITLRKFLEILYDEMSGQRPPVMPGWLARAGMVVPPFHGIAKRVFKERTYDISRAQTLLGYDPPMGTEEGLRRTVRYWKSAHGKA